MENCKLEGLAHVGVFVADIEASKEFYTEMLDFEVIEETGIEDNDGLIKIAFIENGNLVIELVQFPNHREKADGPVDHIALRATNIEALKELLEERGIVFEEEEITFGSTVFPNGSKWILFRGPDGEHLEINEVL